MAGGENYVGLIKGDFVAIKFAPGGLVVARGTLDPSTVSVAAPSDVTSAQLIDLVQRAARAGTLANITVHGLGGDHRSVSK